VVLPFFADSVQTFPFLTYLKERESATVGPHKKGGKGRNRTSMYDGEEKRRNNNNGLLLKDIYRHIIEVGKGGGGGGGGGSHSFQALSRNGTFAEERREKRVQQRPCFTGGVGRKKERLHNLLDFQSSTTKKRDTSFLSGPKKKKRRKKEGKVLAVRGEDGGGKSTTVSPLTASPHRAEKGKKTRPFDRR